MPDIAGGCWAVLGLGSGRVGGRGRLGISWPPLFHVPLRPRVGQPDAKPILLPDLPLLSFLGDMKGCKIVGRVGGGGSALRTTRIDDVHSFMASSVALTWHTIWKW